MRRVALVEARIDLSRLSFGTASLHRLPTRRGRQDLLAATLDRGFTHFDTAPSYGFGISEEELGRFLQGRRDRVTVATKVGLYPPGGGHRSTAAVWIRKMGGRLKPSLSRPIVAWSIAAAEASLSRSLRRLRTDYVDLLLLHEPVSGTLDSAAFLEWLHRERAAGRIKAWGLAGEARGMDEWISTDHPLGMVLQVRDSLDRKEADRIRNHGRSLQITYGYLSASSRLAGVSSAEILREAMLRNATGSLLVSTRRVAHLDEIAAAARE